MPTETQRLTRVVREKLNQMRISLLWWTVAVALYTAINVLVYPAFKESVLLETANYPQGIMDAFGIGDLSALGPYIYAQVFLMLPLVLAFYPIMTFAGAIAGAEENGELDILMTNPLRRRTLVLGQWIAMAIALGLILLITGLLTWLCIRLIGEHMPIGTVMLGAWSVYPITLAVGSIALPLSARLRSRGAVIGFSIGIMFLMYLIEAIGKINPDLSSLRYVSLFRYFGDAISEYQPAWHFALLLGIAVALLALAIPTFEKRDIYT